MWEAPAKPAKHRFRWSDGSTTTAGLFGQWKGRDDMLYVEEGVAGSRAVYPLTEAAAGTNDDDGKQRPWVTEYKAVR